MSKFRILVAGAAVAAGVLLPATAAQASCISLFTTPVDCAREMLQSEMPAIDDCVYVGTFPFICLSDTGA